MKVRIEYKNGSIAYLSKVIEVFSNIEENECRITFKNKEYSTYRNFEKIFIRHDDAWTKAYPPERK